MTETTTKGERYRNQINNDGRTVGYGERFPKYEGEELIIHDTNAACGISHQNTEYQHAFDYTTLSEHGPSGEIKFIEVLEAAGLDPVDDYVRVFRDMGRGIDNSYPDRFLYVWVNEDIMIATTNNPITGAAHSRNHNRNGIGYAGMIGISGEMEKAKKAAYQIMAIASTVKGEEQGKLFY
jgi:hypothetical protein